MPDTTSHFCGRYLALLERDGWEYASRTNASGVAVIIAVTDDRQLVLVEQYRIPVGRRVLELPAGLVGDGAEPGEDMLAGARRELEEETGYSATHWTALLECPSTAGLSDEMVTFFLAEGLERSAPGGGDATESIEVHLVPLGEATEWLERQAVKGTYLDPKIYTALFWLDRRSAPTANGPVATG